MEPSELRVLKREMGEVWLLAFPSPQAGLVDLASKKGIIDSELSPPSQKPMCRGCPPI